MLCSVFQTHSLGGPFWLKMSQSPGLLPFISHPFFCWVPPMKAEALTILGLGAPILASAVHLLGRCAAVVASEGPLPAPMKQNGGTVDASWTLGAPTLASAFTCGPVDCCRCVRGPRAHKPIELQMEAPRGLAEGARPTSRSAARRWRRGAWPRGPGLRAEAPPSECLRVEWPG